MLASIYNPKIKIMTFTPRQRINLDGKTYLLPSDVLQQIKALTKGYEALVLDSKDNQLDEIDDTAIARNDVLNRIASNNK
jgi:hypothetical protein